MKVSVFKGYHPRYSPSYTVYMYLSVTTARWLAIVKPHFMNWRRQLTHGSVPGSLILLWRHVSASGADRACCQHLSRYRRCEQELTCAADAKWQNAVPIYSMASAVYSGCHSWEETMWPGVGHSDTGHKSSTRHGPWHCVERKSLLQTTRSGL